MSPYRSSTDQHDADTRTGMLGEFCGSHPQPPISASRPVTARLARCASCVFSSATGTPGRTSWFSPDWRSRPAIRAPARPGLPRHQRAGENHIVEQARLKIGKLADVWLILVTLPGSMLAFPCWRSDQRCVDKPCRACRATSPQPSMISNLPPPTVRHPRMTRHSGPQAKISRPQRSPGHRRNALR